LGQRPTPIHLTEPWATAASGDYQGHAWVRYTTPSDPGRICYALEIDGVDANTLAFGESALPVYMGYVVSCGVSPGTKASPIQLEWDQRPATATDFGFLSGVVPGGKAIVATFDDGSTQTVPIANDTFTLFYGPGRMVVGLDALAAEGSTLATCTVRTREAINGAMLLDASC
jgi:hypothetical protein